MALCLINLPHLVEPLQALGMDVVGGGGLAETAGPIRKLSQSGETVLLVVADRVAPGLSHWIGANPPDLLVILRGSNNFDLEIPGAIDLMLPNTLEALCQILGHDTTGTDAAQQVIGPDYTASTVAAPTTVPVADPEPTPSYAADSEVSPGPPVEPRPVEPEPWSDLEDIESDPGPVPQQQAPSGLEVNYIQEAPTPQPPQPADDPWGGAPPPTASAPVQTDPYQPPQSNPIAADPQEHQAASPPQAAQPPDPFAHPDPWGDQPPQYTPPVPPSVQPAPPPQTPADPWGTDPVAQPVPQPSPPAPATDDRPAPPPPPVTQPEPGYQPPPPPVGQPAQPVPDPWETPPAAAAPVAPAPPHPADAMFDGRPNPPGAATPIDTPSLAAMDGLFENGHVGGGTFRRGGQAPVIVSIAGKGGVGKSSLALLLGQRAAMFGDMRVIVIDANRGQGDLLAYLRLGTKVRNGELPTIYQVAMTGNPEDAILTPSQINAARHPKLPPIKFGIVFAPTEEYADPETVNTTVYRRTIEAARKIADLVVVDTQIVEASDTSGLFDGLITPMLTVDSWALATSDLSSASVENIHRRLAAFQRSGVPRDRMMLVFNRVNVSASYDAATMESIFDPVSVFMGSVTADESLAAGMNVGLLDHDNPSVAPILDMALARVTGNPVFEESVSQAHVKGKSSKRGLFRFRGRR